VLTLRRDRIMHITIEGLRAGQWQYLTEREQAMLLDAVKIEK
jgi:16S rRNA U516 pseudouridylate synthase RsuA-like enzyme